ncbi:MAG: ATP phosphoribosyltransferase regulatory subunit, partial [Mycoplasmataceae bacterium]|nr:ATP phosphoribosyltransferase regulatory subunit [Mycoplasmataceae bacterium]
MNKPKGTRDYYGKDQELREYIKSTIQTVSTINNFKQIETPIFESAEVFTKAIGETTDIVSKEMFVFNDKKDRTMVLRPEGTAAVIRAAVENKLLSGALPVKLSYYGPMFRYERPQKGRQRQFTQFGVETFSEKNPYIDAETILFAKTILDSLEIEYELVINSLGDKETRVKYSDALKKYFEEYKTELSDLSISRLESNPLRILDDKIDGKKEFVK